MRYRLIFLPLLAVLIGGGLLIFYIQQRSQAGPPRAKIHARLIRMPDSIAKYQLCAEVFAFFHPSTGNPYKTEYTFHDPFRSSEDTVTPLFLGKQSGHAGASFQIRVELRNFGTYTLLISDVAEKDGVAIWLPDEKSHLKSATIPIFVVSSESPGLAVLDYTCPNQWGWRNV